MKHAMIATVVTKNDNNVTVYFSNDLFNLFVPPPTSDIEEEIIMRSFCEQIANAEIRGQKSVWVKSVITDQKSASNKFLFVTQNKKAHIVEVAQPNSESKTPFYGAIIFKPERLVREDVIRHMYDLLQPVFAKKENEMYASATENFDQGMLKIYTPTNGPSKRNINLDSLPLSELNLLYETSLGNDFIGIKQALDEQAEKLLDKLESEKKELDMAFRRIEFQFMQLKQPGDNDDVDQLMQPDVNSDSNQRLNLFRSLYEQHRASIDKKISHVSSLPMRFSKELLPSYKKYFEIYYPNYLYKKEIIWQLYEFCREFVNDIIKLKSKNKNKLVDNFNLIFEDIALLKDFGKLSPLEMTYKRFQWSSLDEISVVINNILTKCKEVDLSELYLTNDSSLFSKFCHALSAIKHINPIDEKDAGFEFDKTAKASEEVVNSEFERFMLSNVLTLVSNISLLFPKDTGTNAKTKALVADMNVETEALVANMSDITFLAEKYPYALVRKIKSSQAEVESYSKSICDDVTLILKEASAIFSENKDNKYIINELQSCVTEIEKLVNEAQSMRDDCIQRNNSKLSNLRETQSPTELTAIFNELKESNGLLITKLEEATLKARGFVKNVMPRIKSDYEEKTQKIEIVKSLISEYQSKIEKCEAKIAAIESDAEILRDKAILMISDPEKYFIISHVNAISAQQEIDQSLTEMHEQIRLAKNVLSKYLDAENHPHVTIDDTSDDTSEKVAAACSSVNDKLGIFDVEYKAFNAKVEKLNTILEKSEIQAGSLIKLCRMLVNVICDEKYWNNQTKGGGKKAANSKLKVPTGIANMIDAINDPKFSSWQTNTKVTMELIECIRVFADQRLTKKSVSGKSQGPANAQSFSIFAHNNKDQNAQNSFYLLLRQLDPNKITDDTVEEFKKLLDRYQKTTPNLSRSASSQPTSSQ